MYLEHALGKRKSLRKGRENFSQKELVQINSKILENE